MSLKRIKIMIVILLVLLLGVCVFGACSEKEVFAPLNFPERLIFELGEDAELPIATSTENSKITYRLTSPSGKKTVESDSPSVDCNEVGEWIVEYICGDESLIRSFFVEDHTSPVLTVTAMPSDVFIGNADGYLLPQIEVFDLSEIDDDSVTKTLLLNGEAVDFQSTEEKFFANEAGEFSYTLALTDIHGNPSQINLKWNAKDSEWRDTELADEKILASYDNSGYINSVKSGDFSPYWTTEQLKEEYLDSFKGANGVLKLTAKLNSYDCAGIKFYLMRAAQKAELQNKDVIIKLYTPCDVDYLEFGSIKWVDTIEGAEHFSFDVIPNEWNYITVSYESIISCHYFDVGEAGFNAFQIGFGRIQTDGMKEDAIIYLDSINIVERLPEGNIADFNDEQCVNMVKANEGYRAATVNAQYLESYEGENGVLKVRTKNKIHGGVGIGDVVLNLPVSCTSGMTVKYRIGEYSATAIKFVKPDSVDGFSDDYLICDNEWHTVYLDYDGLTKQDTLVLLIQGGSLNGINEIYFASVTDGNITN